jgi:hypothetical protein
MATASAERSLARMQMLVASWIIASAGFAQASTSSCDTGTPKEGASGAHEALLDALHEKHLVFVGRSLSHAQYLSLAHEVLHGACPSDTAPLLDLDPSDRAEFYAATSQALTLFEGKRESTETCFCSWIKEEPGHVQERRYFEYDDARV